MDIKWKKMKELGGEKMKKLRVWNLKGDKLDEYKTKVYERFKTQKSQVNGVEEKWTEMRDGMIKTAEEVVGRTKGHKGRRMEDTWWWKEEIREVLKKKKIAFKTWKESEKEEDRELYRTANKETKKAVTEAKLAATQDWYDKLDTREGEKAIYRIAKKRQKSRIDLEDTGVVKDINGKILERAECIKRRWKEYFEELLNVENEREILAVAAASEGPTQTIQRSEVKRAIRKMKCGKASGPSEVTSELLKALGEDGEICMWSLLKEIWEKEKIPDDWRKSTIVPLFKQKGDILECGNYRGIKLMEHGLKIMERVIDERLRVEVHIDKMQFGFMKGKGTVDAMFIVRQLQEKTLEGNEELFCAFIDLEKAYDRVPREVVYWCLRKKGVLEKTVRVIQELYKGVVTTVRTKSGETEEFEVKVGLHQGSALSPFLFIIVMDVLSAEIRDKQKWEMLFADDLVITARTEEELQDRVLKWQESLQAGGLKVNVQKSEVMRSGREKEDIQIRDVRGVEMRQVEKFKYLGSVISESGGCEKDVEERIKAGWSKWREVSGIVCDRRMPRRLKIKIYKTVVRPVIVYGAETWALRKKEERKLERTEMKMIRWAMGISLREHLTNEEIRRRAGIECISELLKRARLQWFGHVARREEENPVKRAWRTPVVGRRTRGRQKMRWMDRVLRDLESMKISEEDAYDRRKWKASLKKAPTPD